MNFRIQNTNYGNSDRSRNLIISSMSHRLSSQKIPSISIHYIRVIFVHIKTHIHSDRK